MRRCLGHKARNDANHSSFFLETPRTPTSPRAPETENVVPRGTIETVGFWSCTPLSDCQHWSIVPSASGTDTSLKTLTQHFVMGYVREVPAGLIALTTNSDPDGGPIS
jgi:hypothetical protein